MDMCIYQENSVSKLRISEEPKYQAEDKVLYNISLVIQKCSK